MNKFRIIVFTLILSYFLSNYFYQQKKIDSSEFSGRIKKITYDDKKYPSATINNTIYDFSFGKTELRINDSLVKKLKSTLVKQYRGDSLINVFDW